MKTLNLEDYLSVNCLKASVHRMFGCLLYIMTLLIVWHFSCLCVLYHWFLFVFHFACMQINLFARNATSQCKVGKHILLCKPVFFSFIFIFVLLKSSVLSCMICSLLSRINDVNHNTTKYIVLFAFQFRDRQEMKSTHSATNKTIGLTSIYIRLTVTMS